MQASSWNALPAGSSSPNKAPTTASKNTGTTDLNTDQAELDSVESVSTLLWQAREDYRQALRETRGRQSQSTLPSHRRDAGESQAQDTSVLLGNPALPAEATTNPEPSLSSLRPGTGSSKASAADTHGPAVHHAPMERTSPAPEHGSRVNQAALPAPDNPSASLGPGTPGKASPSLPQDAPSSTLATGTAGGSNSPLLKGQPDRQGGQATNAEDKEPARAEPAAEANAECRLSLEARCRQAGGNPRAQDQVVIDYIFGDLPELTQL